MGDMWKESNPPPTPLDHTNKYWDAKDLTPEVPNGTTIDEHEDGDGPREDQRHP